MGQMRIATSFATSLALSAATSDVIIYVALFGSIYYDEFASSFINDKRNIVTVSMTMSSGGHRSWLVTHLL